MTDTIDDVAAKAGRREPVEPAIDSRVWPNSWWPTPERRASSWSARTGC